MILPGKTLLVGAIGFLAGCGSGETDDGSAGEQACVDCCHQLKENDCRKAPEDCASFCRERFDKAGAACEDELGAAYACALRHASSCETDPDAVSGQAIRDAARDARRVARRGAASPGCQVIALRASLR
ncbi:uncharacterized protein SOCEGT47_029570 [Sorangium cellulosum]|uniref:Uncharacterized protein n=2 Tax=Sorangium cellulosum TaxID=56 RepID=A0A4P2PZT8_SORCE|nr:uncharacterized protein SOCEGT47_029570 [Sorangium cellulosum]